MVPLTAIVIALTAASPESAAERGHAALTGTAFIRGFWPASAYARAWRQWGVPEKPTDYDTAFRERYGLHPAPYPNDGLPMGLRKADYLFTSGIGIDCLTCHGGSILGRSIVGLGNTSLDIHALFEELAVAGGNPIRMPFTYCQTRGTSEAGAFAVYLLGMRTPDLALTAPLRDLGLKDDAVEDVPAWWLLKKKQTMYHTGTTDARSVRSLMQFMMHPLTPPSDFLHAEPAFRDIQQYLLSIAPPKYPFPIDTTLAKTGEAVFVATCARCHGTYGEKWTYPNKVVPLAEVGTDPKRFENIGNRFGAAYNASWFAREETGKWWLVGRPVRETVGYQAPPLDGVWATAPYFHNGSVPTITGVLNSSSRPKVFTRSFHTETDDYDTTHVGWKVREVPPANPRLPAIERRKVYDTTQPGRGNGGHTYGDDLTPSERRAVTEYLKTL